MGGVVTLDVHRMSTNALRGKATQLTYQLRNELGLPLKQREQMLFLIDELVHELAVRADQGKLF